jgi:branched-chain amino acid transport system permease protein
MQDLLGAATLGSVYLLFALGMSLTWGSIGILNFAHGATFMFSAFAAHLLVAEVRLPFAAIVAIGVCVGAGMSVVTQLAAFEQILKRARDHRTAEMQIIIAGIGIATIPVAVVQTLTLSNPFGFTGSSFATGSYAVGWLRFTTMDVVTIVAAVSLGLSLAVWLQRSRQGLALRSIGVDAEAASMMGINRRRFAVATMAVAGGLAGLSGVLFTFQLGAITAESGDSLLVKAFACIILGGVGSTLGVFVGSFSLALVETYVLSYTSGLWVEAIAFGLIFMMLLLKPDGLFGRKEVRRT